MGRPYKEGLDYSPRNTGWWDDDKFFFIRNKYKALGRGVMDALYCAMYRNGYYVEWNERAIKKFCVLEGVDEDTLYDIMQMAFEDNIFSLKIYQKYQILTSSGVQKRYIMACEQRKIIPINEKIMLVTQNEVPDTLWLKVVITPVNEVSTPINEVISHVNITEGELTGLEVHKEKEKEKEKEKDIKKKDIVDFADIINFLNVQAKTNYRPTTAKTRTLIMARVKEGFTVNDFKAVISKKVIEWLNTDMAQYLRPETLFGTKFESYLNQKNNKPKEKQYIDYTSYDRGG